MRKQEKIHRSICSWAKVSPHSPQLQLPQLPKSTS